MTFQQEIQSLADTLKQIDPKILNRGLRYSLNGTLRGFKEQLDFYRHLAELSASELDAIQGKMETLRSFKIFETLDDYYLLHLARLSEILDVPEDTYLLREGETGDGVYLTLKGEVRILKNGAMLAKRGAGEQFGDMSCLLNIPPSASVRTAVPCQILKITSSHFRELSVKIPDLVHSLMRRLKEASERITELLNHTPSPLIKMDHACRITHEHSALVLKYLGLERIEGHNFFSVLYPGDAKKADEMTDLFTSIYQENSQVFETVMSVLLPREIAYEHPNGSQKVFQLTFYPITQNGTTIISFDIGMEDITRKKRLEELQQQTNLEKFILANIAVDPEGYLSVIDRSHHLLQRFNTILSQSSLPGAMRTELMRDLHTLKGLSGQFGLDQLKQACHHFEQFLLDHGVTLPDFFQQLQEELADFHSKIAFAEQIFNDLPKEQQQRLKGVVIDQEVYAKLKKSIFNEELYLSKQYLHQIESVDAEFLILTWKTLIQDLCEKFGKKANLMIKNGMLKIPKHFADVLKGPLGHIVRNAMDHGIESEEVRARQDKTPAGRIEVSFSYEGEKEERFKMSIQDDGQGLDDAKIVQSFHAKKHQISPEDYHRGCQWIESGEVWRILFLSGFSSREEITDISGRGVGLEAVKSAVEELGGDISISYDRGKGACFHLTFPMQKERFRPFDRYWKELFAQFLKEGVIPRSNQFVNDLPVHHQNIVIDVRG